MGSRAVAPGARMEEMQYLVKEKGQEKEIDEKEEDVKSNYSLSRSLGHRG